MRRLARTFLLMCLAMALGAGYAYSQTPAGQQNEDQWKQTPEGRPAVPPTQMNCSGSITSEDGHVTKISDCPSPQTTPQAPTGASQQFPYPGDSTGDSTPTAQPAPSASQPNQTPGSGTQEPAGKRFPYPGEDSGAPANPQPASSSSSSSSSSGEAKPGDGLQDAGSSGTSSSSSSSSNSVPDTGDAGTSNPPRAARRRMPSAPRLTPTQRETEDLQVASFYQNGGNFRGAYLRAQDAVSIAGQDADAHLALAEAARKLGKLDEAEQHYRRCLALDPVPKTRKAAERALKEMTGGD